MSYHRRECALTVKQLLKAKHENVIRLAKWLGLKKIETFSHGQLARLIRWMVTR